MADILSGLWAKSSTTVISFAVPTTSSLRRIPLNSPRWDAAAARVTPQAFAALRAASALATLCSPGTFRLTSTVSPVSRAFTWNTIPAGD